MTDGIPLVQAPGDRSLARRVKRRLGAGVVAATDRLLASRLVERAGPLLRRTGTSRLAVVAYDSLTGLLVPDRATVRVDGHRATFRSGNVFEYGHFREYHTQPDHPVLRDVLDRLDPDDVFWDVGANVGIYTCFAAGVLADDAVVAVEPHPKNVERIEHNLAANDREAVVYGVALADRTGAGALTLNSPDVPGAFGYLDESGDHTVDLLPGDDLTDRGAPPPTVLKVDVQGGEAAVLRGLSETLDRPDCRLVYCNVYEKHFDDETDAGTVPGILWDHGFETGRLEEWEGGYFLRGRRPVDG